jgi:hypothetical protein
MTYKVLGRWTTCPHCGKTYKDKIIGRIPCPHCVKCTRPEKCFPQFEGRFHCKLCAAQKVITDLTGEEE